MPASESIVLTAMAMPKRPASEWVRMMPTQMTMAGSAVDSIDTAKPWITLVPWPVTEALAIRFTGEKPVPV